MQSRLAKKDTLSGSAGNASRDRSAARHAQRRRAQQSAWERADRLQRLHADLHAAASTQAPSDPDFAADMIVTSQLTEGERA